MNHCGALRIDHVLGLLRLWWVPKGQNASEGAYIYYPVKELLALLALESHRYKCSVIGEDLGTVPDEIVELLSDAGIHSYKVFFLKWLKMVAITLRSIIHNSLCRHFVLTICRP